MPYIQSPMERFNKNNPFVILSKKKYDTIIDMMHDFSKKSILRLVIAAIITGITTILSVIDYIFVKSPGTTIFWFGVIISSALILLTYRELKRKINWFFQNHPCMQEFERISKLEVNDIIALHNEDILNCLNGLHYLEGELNSETKYFVKTINIIIIIESIFFLIGVSLFIVTIF